MFHKIQSEKYSLSAMISQDLLRKLNVLRRIVPDSCVKIFSDICDSLGPSKDLLLEFCSYVKGVRVWFWVLAVRFQYWKSFGMILIVSETRESIFAKETFDIVIYDDSVQNRALRFESLILFSCSAYVLVSVLFS